MGRQTQPNWRSNCPLNIALELLGDKWSLLILRDLLFKGSTTFKEFLQSGEGMASNILAQRLKKLALQNLIHGERSREDARIMIYRPTERALDLLPAMIELILWAARHEKTAASAKMIETLTHDRAAFIAGVRSRFISKID